LTERTAKLSGWNAQRRPVECREVQEYRRLIREAVFAIYYRKKRILASKGMPPQPVSLAEIYLEVRSRIAELRSCHEWPYPPHGKRWVDRRVNETATARYYEDGVPRIVAATAGKYEPNPALFDTCPVMHHEMPSGRLVECK